MERSLRIRPPEDVDDTAGAVRVFQEFFRQYQSVMISAEQYFDEIMAQVQPQFAQAYGPWQCAVKDLLHGVYMISKQIPVRRPKGLADAVRLFSLDGAITMLYDISISCKVELAGNWPSAFKANMAALSAAFRVLIRHKVIGRMN